jgi:hypothetical protein
MSRTKRKIRKWKRDLNEIRIVEGGDAQVGHGWWGNRKMRPYSKRPNEIKFKAESYTGTAPTRNDKLVTKNANRSIKKALRQYLKKQLKDELQSISG